jgi:hypothetical protein
MPTYTVAEMAAMLGISTDAVRARVNRGTLHGTKVAGVWQVRPPDDWPLPEAAAIDRPDPTGMRPDVTGDRPDALIEQLHSENDYLRERLVEAERERERVLRQMADERERFDVIHRTALDRIEALGSSLSDRATDQDIGDVAEPEASQRGVWARLLRLWTGR